jgi:hypothetical protein
MCFSAEGSFAVSAALLTVGGAAVARAPRGYRLLAGVPVLFGAQQAAEGVVWVTLDDTRGLAHLIAVRAFLVVAIMVWPSFLSFALARMEQDAQRRRTLLLLFAMGVVLSAYAAALLLRFPPVARVAGHSIRYDYTGSDDVRWNLLYLMAYLVPTVVPFFVSSMSLAKASGAVLLGSLLLTTALQRGALTSVWCFLAAIFSGVLLMAIRRDAARVALQAAVVPIRTAAP